MIDVFLDGIPTRQRSAALFDQIRGAILTGRLSPGDRLPPTRELADLLGVARSTVSTVYARLVGEGYAEGRVGAGTFVTDLHEPSAPRPAGADASGIRVARPSPRTDVPFIAPPGGWQADLRSGRPDPHLFPTGEWRRCVTMAAASAPPGYGDVAGLPELRRLIAAWITRSRSVYADEDNVLITAGAQGAFDLCARTLTRPGDIVAVEDPGYEPARLAFAHHGVRIVPIPVDSDGMCVDRLPRDVSVVVVTPSHQAPTGATLSAARRRQLLDHARAAGAIVLEDDYDTELRYVDRPLEPLHLLDAHGRVIYVGSFSKTLTPSLRLGFLVAPSRLVAELAAARHLVDAQPPFVTQAALAALMSTGAFERHLRRSLRTYRARRDHLIGELDRLVDERVVASFGHCPAGLHATVDLRSDVATEDIAHRLRAAGIAVGTTAANRVTKGPDSLIVGFGLADEAHLDLALAALAEVVMRLGTGAATAIVR